MKKISLQLIGLQVICAVLATAVLWNLSERSFTESLSKGFYSNAEIITESLAKSVELPMGNRDLISVQTALDSTVKLANTEWAYVTSPDGRAIADTFVPVFPNDLPRSDDSKPGMFMRTGDRNRELVMFTKPVMRGIFGYVHVGFNQEKLAVSIAHEKLIIFATTAAVLLFMSSIVGLLTRDIVAPINKLTRTSIALANDPTAEFKPLTVDSDNEIGVLTSSFNRMMLERQQDRRTVEARVVARTQELLHANVQLDTARNRAEAATEEIKEINTQLEFEAAERKLLEGQLVQAQKLESIGLLAAGIAHEINTPIQYVGDNCLFLQTSFDGIKRLFEHHLELLRQVKTSNIDPKFTAELEKDLANLDIAFLVAEIPAAIDQSIEGVERVSQIVKAMKEFSHPGSGEKAPIDLNRAILNTLVICRNEVKEAAEVVTDLDISLPPVHCFVGEVNQVILNLVVNAAHAMDGYRSDATVGLIRVSTRSDGAFAEIRVQDNGSGIPEQIRNKIFDPFFTTKEVGKGTGQGLAIARNTIVNKHGGTLTFETEVMRGTTFIIRIPFKAKDDSNAEQVFSGEEQLMTGC